MKKAVIVGLVAVLVLAAAGGAFYAGTKVGQNQVLKNPAAFMQGLRGQGNFAPGDGGTGRQFQGGTTGAGGNVTGSVESIDGTTLKVTTQSATVVVQTTDSTLIQKTASVKVSVTGALCQRASAPVATVTGAVLSMVTWSVSGNESFPAASVAVTVIV